MMTGLVDPLELLDMSAAAAWLPAEPENPVDWVEKNVYFDRRQGAVPGYWSHARFPYSKGVLEACADPAIGTIVLKWGTQLGKTTLLGALVAWLASQNPCGCMIATPDQDAAHEHYRTKLNPILEQCPSIEDMRPPLHARQMEFIELGSMWVYYSWSGAPRTLSSRSVPVVVINEINLHSRKGSQEGNPVAMARDRTKGYAEHQRKILIEGKPTIEGDCWLENEFNLTDQRFYFVPCPHCGLMQDLILGEETSESGLKWSRRDDGESDPEVAKNTAYYQCKNGCRIDEDYKVGMIADGDWRATGKACSSAGFELDSLYSNVLTWGEFAESFLQAKAKDQSYLRAFVNSWIAKTWKVESRKTNLEEIETHRGTYRLGEIPGEALAVICTVDVQEDSFYYVIRAWSWRGTSWLVRYGQVFSWDELETVLGDSYDGPDGQEYRVGRVFVDSGYRSEDVYQWCVRNHAIPIKGNDQYRQLSVVVKRKPRKAKRKGRIVKIDLYGLELWLIDKGLALDAFYGDRLSRRLADPGGWSFAADTGKDYTRAMVSYQRTKKEKPTTNKRHEWRSTSPEHEHYCDCEVYQEAIALSWQFNQAKPAPDQPKPHPKPKEKDNRKATFATAGGRDWR